MIIYNYHPITKEYIGQSEADESPLEKGEYLIPAYATDKQPPQIGENQVAVFENDTWVIKDDYRGQRGFKIDEKGFFVDKYEFDIGEKPSNIIILAENPENIYKPKWDGDRWVQGEQPPIQPPSDAERILALEKAISILMGV